MDSAQAGGRHRLGWPIAEPVGESSLDGPAMVTCGGMRSAAPRPGFPACVVHGRASAAVAEIGLVQDGGEDRRSLQSNFGAWVLCTETLSPFRVTGYDQDGYRLADIEDP